MSVLRILYRRLDRLQSTLVFRVAASVIVLVAAGAVFVPLIARSHSIAAQRDVLVGELVGQSVQRRDVHAMSLQNTGTVSVGGRVYGGQWFRDNLNFVFDQNGTISSPVWLANRMLDDQRPAWAPDFLVEQPDTTLVLALAITGSLLLVVWLNLTVAFVITALAGFLAALPFYLAGAEQMMLSVVGIAVLAFAYMLFSRALLAVLSVPWQPFAVAHTVVKEAMRSKLSLFFIVLFVLLLPLVPMRLDPESPLRYRVQTLLSTSMDLTYYIAALLTLFLACATVAFEFRDRQIWQLMSKPVGRFNYLIGKWIGVLGVNLVMLLVAGVSVFMYVQWLRQLPVAVGIEGQLDRLAVEEEVLAARIGVEPDFELLTGEQVRLRMDQRIERDPDLSQLEHVDAATRRKIAGEVIDEHMRQQRTIPAGRGREYIFSGLEEAQRLQSTLTLRYRFFIGRSDEHERYDVGFVFNNEDRTAMRQTYVPTMTHTLPIGSHMIREDGTLSITMYNEYAPPQGAGSGLLMFDPGGVELLFRVGEFESNFLRAVLGMWIKLSFLAMLGVAASTLLSFPVACLLSFTVFLAGTIAPFLASSLNEYYPPVLREGDWSNVGLVIQWSFQSVIRFIAQVIVWLLENFGSFNPNRLLVEGRLISWWLLGVGLWVIGIVWSGMALLVGYVVFRRRELATYSGQG
jgi:ABC-type transport system involved in multi-copper enzyme maturation permease subunit